MSIAWIFVVFGAIFAITNGETILRLCGQALNEVLSIVCEGKLNGLPVKKFESKPISSKHLNNFVLSDHDCKDIYKLTKIRRRRYNSVGIYDECCRIKGCTMNELQSYCL